MPREPKISSMDGQLTLQPNLYLEDCARRHLWLRESLWACMPLTDQWKWCLHTSDTPSCKLWPQHQVSLCCHPWNAPIFCISSSVHSIPFSICAKTSGLTCWGSGFALVLWLWQGACKQVRHGSLHGEARPQGWKQNVALQACCIG